MGEELKRKEERETAKQRHVLTIDLILYINIYAYVIYEIYMKYINIY